MAGNLRSADTGSRAVALDSAACLTMRRPGPPCTDCADGCRAGAIQIDSRSVVVDERACTGCGRCASACPTGALAVTGFAAASIIECTRVPDRHRAAGATVVPCLGGLTAGHLRATLAEGGAVLVDRAWCANCPAGELPAPWADSVAAVNGEAEALGRIERVIVRSAPLPPRRAKAPPAPAGRVPDMPARRQVFARFIGAGPGIAAGRHPQARPPGHVATPALAERISALHRLADSAVLPAALFPSLAFTGGVEEARLVASLCPTGALTLAERPQADELRFDAADCLGCGACIGAPGIVFAKRGSGQYRGRVTLVREPMTDCRRCGSRFAANGGALCPNCRKDTELAAAAFGLVHGGAISPGSEPG